MAIDNNNAPPAGDSNIGNSGDGPLADVGNDSLAHLNLETIQGLNTDSSDGSDNGVAEIRGEKDAEFVGGDQSTRLLLQASDTSCMNDARLCFTEHGESRNQANFDNKVAENFKLMNATAAAA